MPVSMQDFGEDQAWDSLLLLAEHAKAGHPLVSRSAMSFSDGKAALGEEAIVYFIDPDAERGWQPAEAALTSSAVQMLNLYVPLCVGSRASNMVVAHLGQSLDGRIATHNGVSQFITGDENIVHTHRLRALFDAVLVGANTASTDNPRLTTRRARGNHATRVLLDPTCSVDPDASIFTDGEARTLVLCDKAFLPNPAPKTHIGLQVESGFIEPSRIIDSLQQEGIRRLFVEGGGVTVTQFLQAGLLDRLHLCVAPMIIGSGRPSFPMEEVDTLEACVFLDAQHFKSGKDLLFDCQLRGQDK